MTSTSTNTNKPDSGAPARPGEGDLRETDFAALLQQERAVLKAMRKPGALLIPEADWYDLPGKGIYVTPDGQQKIRGALPVPPPPGTPEAVQAQTLRIWKIVTNPLVVEAVPLDSPGNGEGRVNVRLLRGSSPHYRRGMELPGCVPTAAANVWAYGGPRPKHPGRF